MVSCSLSVYTSRLYDYQSKKVYMWKDSAAVTHKPPQLRKQILPQGKAEALNDTHHS